jgi:hypothetical protein
MCTAEEKEELEALRNWRKESEPALAALQAQVHNIHKDIEAKYSSEHKDNKEELEALREWKREAQLAMVTLQAQVNNMYKDVEEIKHNLEHKDNEIKSLKQILGVGQTELSSKRKSRSEITLGKPRLSVAWSEADKPQIPGNQNGTHPTVLIDQFNIGKHKLSNSNDSDIVDSDASDYSPEIPPSPHASFLQVSSLQTFGSPNGIVESAPLIPLQLDGTVPRSESPTEVHPPTESSTDIHVTTLELSTDQQSSTQAHSESPTQALPESPTQANPGSTEAYHTPEPSTEAHRTPGSSTDAHFVPEPSPQTVSSSIVISETSECITQATQDTLTTTTTTTTAITTTTIAPTSAITFPTTFPPTTLTRSPSTMITTPRSTPTTGEALSEKDIPLQDAELPDKVQGIDQTTDSAQASNSPSEQQTQALLTRETSQTFDAPSVQTTNAPSVQLTGSNLDQSTSTTSDENAYTSPDQTNEADDSSTVVSVDQTETLSLSDSSNGSEPTSPLIVTTTDASQLIISHPESTAPLTAESISPPQSPEIVVDAPAIHVDESDASPSENISSSGEILGEHSTTPQIPKRFIGSRGLNSKPLLKIEIPASALGSPRLLAATMSPNLLASPHLPSVPTNTPVSAPSTPVFVADGSPATPKLHMTRPKLPPTRVQADELKVRSSTLKRTSGPAFKREASETLLTAWIPTSPEMPPVPSSPKPTNIDELYSRFGTSSSEESDTPESPHRLQISVSEDRICSPESSDSEDSFLKIKDKYSNSKLEPDALRRYEEDAKRVILVQKVIRGWIHRRRLEKIRKRTEATKELLTTELGYAKCLELLIHHYVRPLRSNSTSANAYILPSQVDEIFSTIEDIRQGSSMLVIELDALMKSWNYFSCVGSIMLSHIDMLQPHMPFVVNYERSQQVLATCSKNKEFAAFLRRRMSSAELDYKTLDDFLILPVQRIPRYIMLLEAIYKYTPASHPDREGVRKAAHQMRLLAEKINKRKASAAKFAEFSSCLKGYEGDITQDGRYLVREGSVTNEKKRPRYAALMNDLIVICKPPEVAKVTKKDAKDAPKKPSYKFVTQMKLDANTNLQVRPIGGPYTITLKNSNTMVVITTGAEDGKGWTKDVHSVLEMLRKKK